MALASRALGAVLVAVLFPTAVIAQDSDAGIRDWTVEKPMVAGFMSGMTLTLCTTCDFAENPTMASKFDPFAMSELVYEQLQLHSSFSYKFGRSMGFIFVLFIVIGVSLRQLNRLGGR